MTNPIYTIRTHGYAQFTNIDESAESTPTRPQVSFLPTSAADSNQETQSQPSPTPLSQRHIEHSETPLPPYLQCREELLRLLKNLTQDQQEILVHQLQQTKKCTIQEARESVSDFLINVIKPESFLHGFITIVCLGSSLGQIPFTIERNSPFLVILASVIGSLSLGALAIDSVEGLPANLRECWRGLSGCMKFGLVVYVAFLAEATASDAYRTIMEAWKIKGFEQSTSIFFGLTQSATIMAIGADALKILINLWPQRYLLTEQPILNKFIIAASFLIATPSAHFVQMGAEQWPNTFLQDHFSPGFANSPGGHALLMLMMSPHFVVYVILETYAIAVLGINIAKGCKRAYEYIKHYRHGHSSNNSELLTSIRRSADRFVCSSKTKALVNAMTVLGLTGVTCAATYQTIAYLLAISTATWAASDRFGVLSNNESLINELGLNKNNLITNQRWANADATGNLIFMPGRVLLGIYTALLVLRGSVGRVAGVAVAIYQHCRGNTNNQPPPSNNTIWEEMVTAHPEILQAFEAFKQLMMETLKQENLTGEQLNELDCFLDEFLYELKSSISQSENTDPIPQQGTDNSYVNSAFSPDETDSQHF